MRTETEPGSFFAQIDIDIEKENGDPQSQWTFGVVETDEDGLSMTLYNHVTKESHQINGITAKNLCEFHALAALYRAWGSTKRGNAQA